jgi:hypothetical protein
VRDATYNEPVERIGVAVQEPHTLPLEPVLVTVVDFVKLEDRTQVALIRTCQENPAVELYRLPNFAERRTSPHERERSHVEYGDLDDSLFAVAAFTHGALPALTT